MSYSTDISGVLANQLTKLSTLNRHQLAGQIANMDFWLAEVRHCTSVLDGYQARFDKLNRAQTDYTREHQTIEFDVDDPYIHGPAEGAKRAPDREMKDARRKLKDAAYRFLRRCLDERLIDEAVI